MMSLNDREWKDFYLSDFFDFRKGNQSNMSGLHPGRIPLVSARKCDNGYKDFVSPNEKPLFEGEILTLNCDGDGGAGIAYYQPNRMAVDSHVTALIPTLKLNKFHLLFVAMCLTRQRSRFGHGYSINSRRLRALRLMLPINQNGNPDWVFIEKYVRAKENDIIKPLLASYEELTVQNYDSIRLPGTVTWSSFDFVDIFEIRKGFYNKKPPCGEDGTIPFIGATDSRNGFAGFTTEEDISKHSKTGQGINEPLNKKIFEGNAICVTNNGSVGYAYYQTHKFTCSHDVNPLYLRNMRLNRHIALFLISCIEKQRVCFTYARKWRPKRMVKSKLLLPVDEKGRPHWPLMESVAKSMEARLICEYIKYAIEQAKLHVSQVINNTGEDVKKVDPFDCLVGDL